MAENKMMVRVIAPERVFYEGEASFLEFNTIEGKHFCLMKWLTTCKSKVLIE